MIMFFHVKVKRRLTQFTGVTESAEDASTVESVNAINTCTTVETGIRGTFVDVSNQKNSNNIKTVLMYLCDYSKQ